MPTPEIKAAARIYQERAHGRAIDHAQTAAALLNPHDPEGLADASVAIGPHATSAALAHATLAVFWQREAHA